jgi:hypothetical protein
LPRHNAAEVLVRVIGLLHDAQAERGVDADGQHGARAEIVRRLDDALNPVCISFGPAIIVPKDVQAFRSQRSYRRHARR